MRFCARTAAPFITLTVLVALLVAAVFTIDILRGAVLIIRAASLHGAWPERLSEWTAQPFTTRDIIVPSRHGPLRARAYTPSGFVRRSVLLTAGVHAEGIDEPRLTKLARDLATTGIGVITPELPDLLEYRITPRLPDMLEDAVAWATRHRRFAPDGRIGVIGISFSGGLSVVATGRPSVRDRVAFTVSFGGHGDLARTLHYLCTGERLDHVVRPPHDYGVVIILLNAAHVFVPPEQVEPLRAGIRTFLRASHIDMVDHAKAQVVFNEAIALEPTLPEPASTLLHYVNTRDVTHLGPLLQSVVQDVAFDPSLSPERSPAPTAPVFLLHGLDDNVIPAVESQMLAKYLRQHGTTVRVLLTPLITHAEMDRETDPKDIWNLLSFWGAVLSK